MPNIVAHQCHGTETREETRGHYIYTWLKCSLCGVEGLVGMGNMRAAAKLTFK